MQQNSQLLETKPDVQRLDSLFSWYAEMRRESPVFYDSGRESWMVFSYQDVKRVLRDWQTFSSNLISDLIAAHEGGAKLTAQELLDFCIVLLVVVSLPPTNLLGNAILCFDEYSQAFERLKNEPTLLPLVIEEVLRYRSSIQTMQRITTTETQLGNQTIPARQIVTVWLGAANRDETQFEQAEAFVVERNLNLHLAFGNGIHFCLGAPLARLEGRLVLRAVLARLPNLRINPTVVLEFIPSSDLHGVKSLPVLF